MAVLDTAAKSREELLYNRYQAGRDVIKRFETDPPYAYVIPQEQHDLPTAAILVEKLLINGIEVHQATRDFKANGEMYKAGDWVVLMDQPFASLVKEVVRASALSRSAARGQRRRWSRSRRRSASGEGGGRGGGGRRSSSSGDARGSRDDSSNTSSSASSRRRPRRRTLRRCGEQPRRRIRPGSSFETPYDVTGWTLPMQMGVTVLMVVEPVTNR